MGIEQVRLRVLWPVLGLAVGQEVRLARTHLIAALLERGYLEPVEGASSPAPAPNADDGPSMDEAARGHRRRSG